MEKLFAEGNLIKSGGIPKDTNASPLVGERIAMSESYRMAIIVEFDAGATDLAIAFQQHDAASAGNSKAIVIANPVYEKLDTATKFSETSIWLDASANAVRGIVVFELLSEELDRANGYGFISCDVTAAAAVAKVVSMKYISANPRLEPAYSVDI